MAFIWFPFKKRNEREKKVGKNKKQTQKLTEELYENTYGKKNENNKKSK